jgi:ElaB/YqjD/DUF883 family membrane-anchored ribosome-binding protein
MGSLAPRGIPRAEHSISEPIGRLPHCYDSRPPISPSPCSAGVLGVVDENVGYAPYLLREGRWGGTIVLWTDFPVGSTGTTPDMFRRSAHSAAISANLREIDGRLRALERHLQRVGSRTSTNAAVAAEGIGEAVASALSSMAERLRGGATSVGSEAAKIGNDALRRLSDEVENRPLVVLAVAVGVGILVGLSFQRHS